jgi:membrane-anchored protein YejM (alkaline phosphatase superfamily)
LDRSGNHGSGSGFAKRPCVTISERLAKPMMRSWWQAYSTGRALTLRWLGWTALANALLLLAIGLTYVAYARADLTPAGGIFLFLGLLGQFLLLAFLVYLPLAALSAIVPRWLVAAAAIPAYAALALLILIDTRVFAIYRFHLNSRVWHLLNSGVASDILPLTGGLYLLVAGYLAALVAVECALALGLRVWVKRASRRFGWPAAAVSVLIVLGSHVLHAWADANQLTDITRQVRFIPWAEMTRAGDFFEKHGWAAAETAALGPRAGGTLRYPAAPLTCRRPAAPLNIVVILIDGWRKDFLTPQITPNLFALAQRSWRFEQHYSSANETRYGVFGALYGLDATYWDDMLRERRGPVLVDQLLAEGYRIGAWGGAPLNHPEFDLTVFAAIRSRLTLRLPGDAAWQRDAEMTRRFAAFLGEGGSAPFFAFLFYDSTHEYSYDPAMAPFQPAVQGGWFAEPPERRDPVPIRNRYMNSTHYADALIGQALARLKAAGHADDTIVIVTGDHGEEFNDSGLNYWGHAGGGMTRWQVQTPLIVHWPGQPARDIRHWTSHVDLAPTLMARVLGCSTPAGDYSNGRDLLDASPRPYLVAYNGIRLAVMEPDRITVLYEYGGMDVVNPDYRDIPNGKPRPEIMNEVLRDTSRFYRR